jgi:hypothetical protein
VVRDDVVQLASDPRPLAAHRELDERFLRGCQLARPAGQLVHEPPPTADLHTRPPQRQCLDGDLDVGRVGEADLDLERDRQRHDGEQALAGWGVGAAGVGEDGRHLEHDRRRREVADR